MRERSDAGLAAFPAETYRFHSNDDVRQLFLAAGFERVDIKTSESGAELRIVEGRVSPAR